MTSAAQRACTPDPTVSGSTGRVRTVTQYSDTSREIWRRLGDCQQLVPAGVAHSDREGGSAKPQRLRKGDQHRLCRLAFNRRSGDRNDQRRPVGTLVSSTHPGTGSAGTHPDRHCRMTGRVIRRSSHSSIVPVRAISQALVPARR